MDEFNRIISDNEQDRAHILQWWLESTPEDKMQLVACMSREYRSPVMEVMSRFAMLKFGEMAEQEERLKRQQEEGE